MPGVTTIAQIQALKDFYLSAWRNQAMNSISPFLGSITETPTAGKKIVAMAPIGVNGGFGFGQEGQPLPVPGGNRYENFTEVTKDMFVPLRISDKAIRATQGAKTAFVDLFDAELKAGFETAKWNVSRSLFGDGNGILSTSSAVSAADVVVVAQHKFFVIGLTLDIYATGAVVGSIPAIGGRRIKDIKRNADGTGELTLDGGIFTAGAGFITVQNSYGRELTGLNSIFNNSVPVLYGLNKANNIWLNPTVKDMGGTITDTKIRSGLRESDDYKNGKVNMIMASNDTYDSYADYLRMNKLAAETVDLKGGFKGIKFIHGNREITVLDEKWVPAGEAWGVCTSDFKLYSLGDWDWMDLENAPQMQRVSGTSDYEMSLVKYANLICENPGGCVRFTNCA